MSCLGSELLDEQTMMCDAHGSHLGRASCHTEIFFAPITTQIQGDNFWLRFIWKMAAELVCSGEFRSCERLRDECCTLQIIMLWIHLKNQRHNLLQLGLLCCRGQFSSISHSLAPIAQIKSGISFSWKLVFLSLKLQCILYLLIKINFRILELICRHH